MDCCNYGEYRGYGAGAAWDGYGYAPLPYAPYAQAYYSPHAHDPYARYYRYDYPGHYVHHTEHAMPMDYGAYAVKEPPRPRRSAAHSRREQRPHAPGHHAPPTLTPPLECAMTSRGSTYCDPQMWPHFQMGVSNVGGWSGAGGGGSWSRGGCSRYAPDYHMVKGSNMQTQNQACAQEGGANHYNAYDIPYNGDTKIKSVHSVEQTRSRMVPDTVRPTAERDTFYHEQPRPPLEEKRPPVVPLPAFQQAFGSTEIGKFAEAFSRADVAHENQEPDSFAFETFADWDGPQESQWPPQAPREIKCEDNF